MSLFTSLTVEKRKKLFVGFSALALISLIALGAMAKNGWLPSTDPLTGKKTGWFGKELPKNAASNWNPMAAPLPSPTPQLSKEYIYAGSRLLAVEDANANAAPPADLAVWRPSNGSWYVLGGPGSATTTVGWGLTGDVPAPGDFDGDGKTDFSVFRPSNSTWYMIPSSNPASPVTTAFGATGDIPAPADFDGDGKTDVAIWRPSDGYWHVIYSATSSYTYFQFGISGDVPAPADYDGDGKADTAVWRSSNKKFYVLRSSTTSVEEIQMNSATAGSFVVSADYDGDTKADHAIFDNSTTNATWYIRRSTTGTQLIAGEQFGLASDKPVQNDYDGDGKVDIAVWRDSNTNWYISQSASATVRTQQWGASGDIPVPAFYRR